MADVTREMILEYVIRKGGVVKNVDLVRHFRKYLQVDDPRLKGEEAISLSVPLFVVETVCASLGRVGSPCLHTGTVGT